MIPTREQMEKAREYLSCLKLRSDISLGEDGYKQLETALVCIDLLLNAREVLPPKREQTEKNIMVFTPNEVKIGRWAFINGHNARADEDIVIVARKLAGLEGVIKEFVLSLDEDMKTDGAIIYEKDWTDLALAIAQHLKGK